MIEVQELTRRYGRHLAVDGVSSTAQPGRVTGFLGPNGAGKSTSMRMIAGLIRPTSGRVLVGGPDRGGGRGRRASGGIPPLRALGALLDPAAVDAGRTGADHLRWMAHSNGIGAGRIGEVLDLVGLAQAGSARAGTYSLGMRQRLGIAGALLGDPPGPGPPRADAGRDLPGGGVLRADPCAARSPRSVPNPRPDRRSDMTTAITSIPPGGLPGAAADRTTGWGLALVCYAVGLLATAARVVRADR